MYSVGYILFGNLLLCVVTINGHHHPIDHNFINTFDAIDTNGVNYRLPNNTKPEHYGITLATDVDKSNFTFTGEVIITLRALEPTKNITIHHRQLNIGGISLQSKDSPKKIPVGDWTYDKTTEFLVVPLPDALEKDQRYFLTVTYSGTLRSDMGGFYRSSYINSKNEKRFAPKLNDFSLFESFNAGKDFINFKFAKQIVSNVKIV